MLNVNLSVGGWTDWADWEECSKKSGEVGGVQIRRRSLTLLSLPGGNCDREDIDIRPCKYSLERSMINEASLNFFKTIIFTNFQSQAQWMAGGRSW